LTLALWVAAYTLAAAGSLVVTVTDPSGDPVQGALVQTYDARLGSEAAQTDASGQATIDDLSKGLYRVRVTPPAHVNLLETWYPGVDEFCLAEQLSVTNRGTVEAPTFVLDEGAEVHGRLVDEQGAPMAEVRVTGWRLAETVNTLPRSTTTEDDGTFALRGLPADASGPSTHVLQAVAEGWPSQYWGGTYGEDGALVVLTSRGEVADLGDWPLLAGITVSGTVLGPGDVPVADAEVHVNILSPYQEATAFTDSDGRYTATGLPPGDVLAMVAAPGLATTYWPDADRPSDRVVVDEEGATLDAFDLHMPEEATLQGTLMLADGTPLDGATLRLHNDDSSVALALYADAAGGFVATGLHPGNYRLQVFSEALGGVDDYLRDRLGQERILRVGAGADEDLGVLELPRGIQVFGQVTELGSGAVVHGAILYAEGTDGTQHHAMSGANGRYTLSGLPPGTWKLWSDYQSLCPDDPSLVTRYHPGEVNAIFSDALVLWAGDQVKWDIEMPPDADLDDMGDLWELGHGLNPNRNDADRDPDEDGYTNVAEYLLGTDPTGPLPGGCHSVPTGLGPWWVGLLALGWRRRSTGMAALALLLAAPAMAAKRSGATSAYPVPSGFVALEVAGVAPSEEGNVVFLRDEHDTLVLPITVGQTEALAIATRASRRRFERPLTHDLMETMLGNLGGSVVSVRIDNLNDGVFAATITLAHKRRFTHYDARASDAIALALGANVPILVEAEIVAAASVSRAEIEAVEPEEEPAVDDPHTAL
jgi:uncharacterized protein